MLLWGVTAMAVLLVPFAFLVSSLDGLAMLMLGSAILVLASIVAGVRLHRPRFPRAWWLIFTSVALALAGNVIWATILPTSISGNAAAINIIYGITYPILCTGVALLPNHRTPGAARIGMLESAIIASCVAVIWWMMFVDPALIDTGSIGTHAYLLVEPLRAAAWPGRRRPGGAAAQRRVRRAAGRRQPDRRLGHRRAGAHRDAAAADRARQRTVRDGQHRPVRPGRRGVGQTT